MLDSLRSFQKTTKLASYLLGDIETEFPGLIAKMNGEPTTDDSVVSIAQNKLTMATDKLPVLGFPSL